MDEMSNKFETNSEISMSIFEVRSSDEEITSTNDRFSKVNGYHVVPPPITGNFLTLRVDISFTGLDEFAIRKKIIESQITKLNTKTSETAGQTNAEKPKSASESVVSNPKIDRDRVIIEDWNSDDKEEEYEVQIVRLETQTVQTRDDKSGQNSKKQGIGFRKGNPKILLQDHVVVDSGCSSHMTGNKAYLSDYEDFNGGFVAFGRDPNGGFLMKSSLLRASRKDDVYSVDLKETLYDNETEFKNHAMNEFCAKKGIKREFNHPKWICGDCPNWMFDLDFLTNSMNYIPVSVENQVNVDAEDVPPPAHEKSSKSSPKDNDVQDLDDAANKESEQDLQDELEMMVTQELAAKAMDDVSRQAFQASSTNKLSIDRPSVSTDRPSVSTDRPSVSTDRPLSNTPYVSDASTSTGANAGESSFVYLVGKILTDASTLPNADLPIDLNMSDLEETFDTLPNDGIFNEAYDDDEDVGAVADFNNIDNTIAVSPIPTL
ncbi:hypothetical protein Tco_1036582, partial [Tanacetum coccineum]